ncbi:MAG TPA: hypothetical protein VGN75_15140 [Kaistia sp.]|nr:hypothetical protein [Kaistia sp.]
METLIYNCGFYIGPFSTQAEADAAKARLAVRQEATSAGIAAIAAHLLASPTTPADVKSVAGSALTQSPPRGLLSL